MFYTKYKIFTSEWDCGSKTLRYNADCPAERIKLVQTMNERIRWDKTLLDKVIASFNCIGINHTADDMVRLFKERAMRQSVFSFIQNLIKHLKKLKRQSTAANYASALRSLIKFRHGNESAKVWGMIQNEPCRYTSATLRLQSLTELIKRF